MPPNSAKKITCFGEILVDFVARGTPPSLADAEVFEKFLGGAPANTASALGRLGADVAMLGAVGTDHFGESLKKQLQKTGVDTRYVQSLKGRPTAVVFVSLDAQKVPNFQSSGDGVAYNFFKAHQNALQQISRSKILHFSSVSLIQEPYKTEAKKALETARKAGVWVSFDPNIRLHLFPTDGMARKRIKEAIPYANILKFGKEEFKFLFGDMKLEKVCEKLAKNGAKLILITDGDKGSTFYYQGVLREVKAFPVKVVDTTGAGDAFIGGILSRMVNLEELEEVSVSEMEEIVRFASAVAALSTTKRGATTGQPSLEGVRRFLRRN